MDILKKTVCVLGARNKDENNITTVKLILVRVIYVKQVLRRITSNAMVIISQFLAIQLITDRLIPYYRNTHIQELALYCIGTEIDTALNDWL